jgi:hypothetical protein
VTKRALYVVVALTVALAPTSTAEPRLATPPPAHTQPVVRQVDEPAVPGVLPSSRNDSATWCNPKGAMR